MDLLNYTWQDVSYGQNKCGTERTDLSEHSQWKSWTHICYQWQDRMLTACHNWWQVHCFIIQTSNINANMIFMHIVPINILMKWYFQFNIIYQHVLYFVYLYMIIHILFSFSFSSLYIFFSYLMFIFFLFIYLFIFHFYLIQTYILVIYLVTI